MKALLTIIIMSIGAATLGEMLAQIWWQDYVVTRIKDGDTFVINDTLTVRLIGANSPEIHKRLDCYGPEATSFARQLVYKKHVLIGYDKSKYDQYGRTLAYLYLPDSTDIAEKLIRNGYALSECWHPNCTHKHKYDLSQDSARAERLGMWSTSCGDSLSNLPTHLKHK